MKNISAKVWVKLYRVNDIHIWDMRAYETKVEKEEKKKIGYAMLAASALYIRMEWGDNEMKMIEKDSETPTQLNNVCVFSSSFFLSSSVMNWMPF